MAINKFKRVQNAQISGDKQELSEEINDEEQSNNGSDNGNNNGRNSRNRYIQR